MAVIARETSRAVAAIRNRTSTPGPPEWFEPALEGVSSKMNPDDEVFHDVLGALHSEMSRVMRQFRLSPDRPAFPHPAVWRPATDIFETRSDIIIRMEVAGTNKEDITVVFAENVLAVRGVRREDPKFRKTGVSRVEIDYGPFEQRIALPQTIDAGGIEAAYKDGFLTIRVPKSVQVRTQTVRIRIRE